MIRQKEKIKKDLLIVLFVKSRKEIQDKDKYNHVYAEKARSAITQ